MKNYFEMILVYYLTGIEGSILSWQEQENDKISIEEYDLEINHKHA